MIERIRTSAGGRRGGTRQQIEEARRSKVPAIESQEFQTAARLRDQERGLTEQQARAAVQPDVFEEIRKRLGISGRISGGGV